MSLPSSERDLADAFAGVAEQYCRVLDSRARSSPSAFLAQLLVAIPTLYAAGARLPSVAPGED